MGIKKIRSKLMILSLVLTLFLIPGIFSAAFSGAAGSSFTGGNYQTIGSYGSVQFNSPDFYLGSGINPSDYWLDFDKEDCDNRQDMIVMIAPGGCSPAVVTSDLLEEQNVPVFCKVMSIQANPLIDITKIRSIRFSDRELSEGVASVSYYPARAAVRSNKRLEASPVVDNIGYLVIVLKKQKSEKDMKDFVQGNLTAVIDYNAEGIFGVGQQEFYLNEMDDEDWARNYREGSFWRGKGYIRANSIEEDSASISIYQGSSERDIATFDLKEGETSRRISLGGYYCSAGMNVKVEDIGYPRERALLRVDDEDIWVAEGSKFLEDKCRVRDIQASEIGGGIIKISCTGSKSFQLELNPGKATLQTPETPDMEKPKEYKIGDLVYSGVKTNLDSTPSDNSIQNVQLGYVGKYPGAKSNYVILVSYPSGTVNPFEKLGAFINTKQNYWVSYGHKLEQYKSLVEFTWWSQIATSFWTTEEERYFKYLVNELVETYNINQKNFKILTSGDSNLQEWKEYGIKLVESTSGEALLKENATLSEYYNNALKNYEDLAEIYPDVKSPANIKEEDVYGALALYQAAEMAGTLGLQGEQIDYLTRLIETYPDSKSAVDAQNNLDRIYRYAIDKNAQALVYVDNDAHFFSLFDMKKPGYNELGADLIINNKEMSLTKDETLDVQFTDSAGKSRVMPIKIVEIADDEITLEYNIPNEYMSEWLREKGVGFITGASVGWNSRTITTDQTALIIPGFNVKLVKTNFNKQVVVKIIPEVRGTRTETNLSFKVGIEKRAIKLSPEKTKDMIIDLDKQIKKWNDINSKLGNVVKGLKGACFATSAMLTVKNFFSGLSGESMARSEIMTAKGGWNEFCKQEAAKGNNQGSVQKCLLENNDKINNDVKAYAESIKKRNDAIKAIQNNLPASAKTADGWFTESYNIDAVTAQYNSGEFAGLDKTKKYKLNNGAFASIDDVVKTRGSELTIEEMRELVTLQNTQGSEVLNNVRDKKISDILSDVDTRFSYENGKESLVTAFKDLGVSAIEENEDAQKVQQMNAIGNNVELQKRLPDSDQAFLKSFPVSYGRESGIASAPLDNKIAGKKVLIGLSLTGAGAYEINNAVTSEGVVVTDEVKRYYSDLKISQFKRADESLYKNPIKEKAKVQYYERAPYKGLPALVPFDEVNGWYAATDYIISGFGKPYEDSGRVVNFWVCNVGENGLIEFKKGDDCRYYNVGSSAELNFPGLSKAKSEALVEKAQKAIAEASRQYPKKSVTINGKSYDATIANNGASGSCSDFMSPFDCNLMFNLCDPVICPESRCDFGGQYRVDNVVQSGIIGSLLLCLPNAKENIAIPICLSGVHAGIEGYVSILNSTRECLQESLDTGRNVGICDEIKSIYLCEFFWKQAAPLMNNLVPRLFEGLQGQGARGGGEYLTVQSAWDNAQKSTSYFTNEYAVNSLKAFNLRSTAEAGTEICQNFVGTRYPTSADMFNKLLEPDSPSQYSAWFSEDVMTTATLPPLSHYKVYYHIYAGKDIGAQYVVYLKTREEGLVTRVGEYVVDRGYIKIGGQVDQARDFEAVSGFNELCIVVNGKEDCGFKQVSTSFAADYLAGKYASEQASGNNIKTSEECVAGQPSLTALAQPNLQAGVTEAVQPELYKRGILRVCSTNNPGKQADKKTGQLDVTNSTTDRWKEVGWCDERGGIRCWVDTDSVKDVLAETAPYLLNETLDSINVDFLNNVDIFTLETSKDILTEAEDVLVQIKAVNKNFNVKDKWKITLMKLDNLTEKGSDDSYKAGGFFYAGRINDEIARQLYKQRADVKAENKGTTVESAKIKLQEQKDILEKQRIELARKIQNGTATSEDKAKLADLNKKIDSLTREEESISEVQNAGEISQTGASLTRNILIKLTKSTESCSYKYNNDKWEVFYSDSMVTDAPYVTLNCALLDNLDYLSGIDKIINQHFDSGGTWAVDSQIITTTTKTGLKAAILEKLSLDVAQAERDVYTGFRSGKWTYDTALAYIKYNYDNKDWTDNTPAYRSGTPANDPVVNTKTFIDSLYNSGLLTAADVDDIDGIGDNGGWGEENMKEVRNKLLKNGGSELITIIDAGNGKYNIMQANQDIGYFLELTSNSFSLRYKQDPINPLTAIYETQGNTNEYRLKKGYTLGSLPTTFKYSSFVFNPQSSEFILDASKIASAITGTGTTSTPPTTTTTPTTSGYDQKSIFMMKIQTTQLNAVKYYTFINGEWRYVQYGSSGLTSAGIQKINWDSAKVAFTDSNPNISKDFEKGVFALKIQESANDGVKFSVAGMRI